MCASGVDEQRGDQLVDFGEFEFVVTMKVLHSDCWILREILDQNGE